MKYGDVKTKVSVILETLKEHKTKYICVTSKDGKEVMKIQLRISDEELVDFVDTFYDNGFIVKRITKGEFDDYEAEEKISFNL